MFPRAKMTIVYDSNDTEFVWEQCIDRSPAVRLIPLSIPDDYDFSIWDYCRMMASVEFWDLFQKSDRVLMFQTDTGVRKNSVLRYLEYSYIGAPWGGPPKQLSSDGICVGNGGLSLRDPKLMKHICEVHPYNDQYLKIEDVYFSRHVAHATNAACPTVDVAAGFSMEHVTHQDPMCFHQVYLWHPRNVLDPLLDNCDPVAPSHNIACINDAWVEMPNGYQSRPVELKPWVEIGLGPSGLTIPADTLVPGKHCGVQGMHLCVQWKTKDEGMKEQKIRMGNDGRICSQSTIK